VKDIQELEHLAVAVPEMGGRRIGKYLRALARDAKAHTSIVELGCWLGAGTTQMAIGLNEREPDHGVAIDCFDNFQMSESSSEKARKQGVDLKEGENTEPWVANTLKPFGHVTLHKGMLDERTRWSGRPISVYVDDASKYPHTFNRCLKIFGPWWIPGETTVVLMDYWLFRKKHNAHRVDYMRSQFDFVTSHPDHFEEVEDLKDGTCAAFRYRRSLDFSRIKVPAAKSHPAHKAASWIGRLFSPKLNKA
jgi:hypothetical protein